MAGSYDHITDEDGGLIEPREILNRLDAGGDLVECIEQLYGMIWFLANDGMTERNVLEKNEDQVRADLVKHAKHNYDEGLKYSPTERYQEFDEGRYAGWSMKEIIHDYGKVRGDLSAPYARKQLVDIIENRIKKAREGKE